MCNIEEKIEMAGKHDTWYMYIVSVSLVLVLMEGEIVILFKTLQFLFISVEERILWIKKA